MEHVEELYTEAVNGADSLAQTRFQDAGGEYQRAFELLKIIAEGREESAPLVPKLRGWGWVEFEPVLAATLAALGEDSYLILPVKFERTFVQFAAQGATGMRAEVSANSVLPPHSQLSQAQLDRLVELGWRRPTGSLEASTPIEDPHGSPNFFLDLEPPVDFEALARLTIDTFVEVLQVPYPNDLVYKAFGPHGAIELPELKLSNEDRPAPEPETPDTVRAALREVLAGLLPPGVNAEDEHGNFSISVGGTPVFLLVMEDTPGIRVVSPAVDNVTDRPKTLEIVNDINRRFRFASLQLNDDAVVAVEDLRADPFDWNALHRAISGVLRAVHAATQELPPSRGDRPSTSSPPRSRRPVGGYL